MLSTDRLLLRDEPGLPSVHMPSVLDVFDNLPDDLGPVMGTIDLCYILAWRSLMLARRDDVVLLPAHLRDNSFLRYRAKQLDLPMDQNGRDASNVVFVDVRKFGAFSVDYAKAALESSRFLELTRGRRFNLRPYVYGPNGHEAAKMLNLEWPYDPPEILEQLQWRDDKVLFHEACVRAGIPTIPESIPASVREYEDIAHAVRTLLSRNHPKLMLRMARAGGGEGNAILLKDKGIYIFQFQGKSDNIDEANLDDYLLSWNNPEDNPYGVMVAPYIEDKTTFSGVVRVAGGLVEDIQIIYIGRELTESDHYIGFRCDPATDQTSIRLGEELMISYAKYRQEQGYRGELQLDMIMVTDTNQMYVTESNTGRVTASQLALAGLSRGGSDWVTDVAAAFKSRTLPAFVSYDHRPLRNFLTVEGIVGRLSSVTVEEIETFTRLPLPSDFRLEDYIDITIPPHYLHGKPLVGVTYRAPRTNNVTQDQVGKIVEMILS